MDFSIRKFVLALFVAAPFGTAGFSQSVDDPRQNSTIFLLSQPRHVEGQVVGEDGNPMAKVRLYHLNLTGDIVTGSDGRFALDTSAPAFVFQRPGFESVLVRTNDVSNVLVVLRKIPKSAAFPVCSPANHSDREPGWSGIFQVPRTPAAKVSREVLDVDFWSRTIHVKSKPTHLQAIQGRGPMWGGAQLEDELVWGSVRYVEQTYDLGGQLLTDAKAWLPNGKCSRTIGVWQESVSYSSVDCSLAEPLDHILDRICAIPGASEHRSK